MTGRRRHPNTALRAAIGDTRLPYGELAAAVNSVAAETGTPLYYDRSTIAHWLTGTTPRRATIPIILETFARLLDRPDLTAADLGWPTTTTTTAKDPWRGDPVAWITHLGRDDMLNRRSALTTGLYSLAAAALPERPHQITSRTGPAQRAGESDVARIRATTEHFNVLDDLYGGGHARSAVAAYLVHDIAPLLRGTTGAARPVLFQAAAELTYLAGWMAADAMKVGLAQWYYVQAVRLADEAGAPVMRSTALRSLAVQAIELGHNRAGRDLADAASDGIRTGSPARTRAWITGMCAEALAAARQDPRRARGLLRTAEADLERADSLPEHQWVGNYRRESFEHQVGLTLTQLGDLPGAEKHFAASVGSRRTVERRTRALIGTRLAHVQLRQRHAEEAARTLLGLSDDLAAVSSERVRRTLSTIRRDWQPYRATATVGDADRMLADLPAITSG